MAKLPASFNPGAPNQKGLSDFSTIPIGEYVAHITKSEMKNNKETANDPNGEQLVIIWTVLQGEFTEQTILDRLNLVNISDQTVEIANKRLKSIADAVGVNEVITDSAILHGHPCLINVGLKKGDAQYPDQNVINKYSTYDPSTPTPQAQPQTPQANVPVSGRPPWQIDAPVESKRSDNLYDLISPSLLIMI